MYESVFGPELWVNDNDPDESFCSETSVLPWQRTGVGRPIRSSELLDSEAAGHPTDYGARFVG